MGAPEVEDMTQIWVTDPERFHKSLWSCSPQAGMVSPRL